MKTVEKQSLGNPPSGSRYYPKRINRYLIGTTIRTKAKRRFNFPVFPIRLLSKKRSWLGITVVISFLVMFSLMCTKHERVKDSIDVKIFLSLPFFGEFEHPYEEVPKRFLVLPPFSLPYNETTIALYAWNSTENQDFIKQAQITYFRHHPLFNASTPRGDAGEGCVIEHQNPFDSSILHLIHRPKPIFCPTPLPGLFRTYSNYLVRTSKLIPNVTKCCYKVIKRKSDFQSQISEVCYPITANRTKIKFEFIQVYCENNQTSETEYPEQIFADTFTFTLPKPSESKSPKKLPSASPSFNIIVLVLSSVSRMNLYRTMPSTVDYINSNMVSFEFTKFSKTGSDFSSLLALLTGQSMEQSVQKWGTTKGAGLDKCPFIWKKFETHGYDTLFAEDSVSSSFTRKKPGFWTQPTNYYFQTASLTAKGFCLGSRLLPEKVFHYSRQLMKSSPKYFQVLHFSSFTRAHESGSVNLDKIFTENLQRMDPFLNRTILVFLSTQGKSTGDLRQTYHGSVEERNPFLFYILPKGYDSKFNTPFQNLFENQNKFTTPFDVHETLQDLLYLKISPKSLAQRQRWAVEAINKQESTLRGLEKFKLTYENAVEMFHQEAGLKAIQANLESNAPKFQFNLSYFNSSTRYEYTLYQSQTRWNASYSEKLYQLYFRKLQNLYSSKLRNAFGKTLPLDPEDMIETKEVFINKLQLSNRNGISHFLDLLPNRGCEIAGIDEHACPCVGMSLERNFPTDMAEELAKAVIKMIHNLFYSYNLMLSTCAYLKLDRVLHFAFSRPLDSGDNNFRIIFQVSPGGGIFEATVRRERGKTLIPGVSRLDPHHKFSYCLGIEELKKFCHCTPNPVKVPPVENVHPIDLDE